MPLPCNFCCKWSLENQRCHRCLSVYYCDKRCQRKDWKKKDQEVGAAGDGKGVSGHRSFCRKPPAWSAHFDLPANFPAEYARAFPEDPNKVAIVRRLGAAHDLARARALDPAFLCSDIMSPAEMSRKAKSLHRGVLMKGKAGQGQRMRIGDVLQDDERTKLSFFMEQMVLRNHPPLRLRCQLGETYVGVGFVDLLQLLLSSIELNDRTTSAPLLYIGVDAGKNQIARNHVIHHMMLDEKTTLRSILQVWFSTVLDKQAYDSFLSTCLSLERECDDPELVQVFLGWINQAVLRRDVTDQFASTVDDAELALLNSLRNERDRIDYAHYVFNGIIFVTHESKSLFGNPSFYLQQDAMRGLARNSFFFQMDLECLKDYETSLFATIDRYFTARLERLRQMICSGKVICKFFYRMLFMGWRFPLMSQEDNDIKQLRSFNANVIDWSNVPDYFPIDRFLKWAQLCGTDKTLHTLHLINWYFHVYGAAAIDISQRTMGESELQATYISARNLMSMDREKEFADRPYLKKIMLLNGVTYFSMSTLDLALTNYFKHSFVAYVEELSRKDGRAVVAKVSGDHGWQRLSRLELSSFDFTLASRNLSQSQRRALVQKYLEM